MLIMLNAFQLPFQRERTIKILYYSLLIITGIIKHRVLRGKECKDKR